MKSPEEIPRYAALAARALKAEEGTPVATSLGDRAGDLAAIDRALRGRGRGRGRVWTALAGTAVAAAVGLFVLATRNPVAGEAPREGPGAGPSARRLPALAVAAIHAADLSLEIGGDERPAVVGEAVAAGTRLNVTAGGEATLVLATGTRLELGSGSSTRVAELDRVERFDLLDGTLRASVAKLGPGRRFLVGTPDVEVEVKGTRFNVAVDPEVSRCEPAVRTRVTVEEGIVVVRHGGSELRLGAGTRWPDCSAVPAAPSPAKRRARPGLLGQTKAHAVPTEKANAASGPPSPPPDPSTLAEQNDLFSTALAAVRRGDLDEAVHWLDRLLARYPTGPLADSARAERFRLVTRRTTAPE